MPGSAVICICRVPETDLCARFRVASDLRPVFDTHVLVYLYIGIVEGIPAILVTTRDQILLSRFHVSVVGF